MPGTTVWSNLIRGHLFHADCSGIIQKKRTLLRSFKATWSPKAGTGPIAEFLDPRDSNDLK